MTRASGALRWFAAAACLLTAITIEFVHVDPALAAPRSAHLALVIGNAGYAQGPLPIAANDAGLVAQSLAQAGFDVTGLMDADPATLHRAVTRFAETVKAQGPNGIVLVYVSGYGLQFAGANYLVPVGARIARQADIPREALPLEEITGPLDALPARARLFVFDLARQTPFAADEPASLAKGLMPMEPPAGSLYAFNAAPDLIAEPDLPPYGAYARALAETLRTPHLSLAAIFVRIRLRVAELSNGAVVPWASSAVAGELTLGGQGQELIVPPAFGDLAHAAPNEAYWTAIGQDTLEAYETFVRTRPEEAHADRLRLMIAIRREALTWAFSVAADKPAAYWAYMLRYPRGPHYVDVRRRLAALKTSLEPPPRFEPYDVPGLATPGEGERKIVSAPPSTSRQADAAPGPGVPDTLLPPPPPAFYMDLPPPTLAPCGALPLPAPIAIGAAHAAMDMPGQITEPFVPHLGAVTVQSGVLADAAAMTLTTSAGLLTRTLTTAQRDGRAIVETDGADEVLSRISINRADTEVTISQTDDGSSPSLDISTKIDALGQRVTRITTGADELIAAFRANPRGTVTETKWGHAPFAPGCFVAPDL
jgi:uncharacterized caspase-like protein